MASSEGGGQTGDRGARRTAAGCWARLWLTRAALLAPLPFECPVLEHTPAEACGAAAPCGVRLHPPAAVPGTHRVTLQYEVEGPVANVSVLLQPSEGEPFEAVASAPLAGVTVIDRGPAWLLDWPTASIKLEACGSGGVCVESEPQPLAGALVGSVAEVGSASAESSLFSLDVALSADGSTLAVSGNDRLEGEPPFGAVLYVFQRDEAGVWQRELRVGIEHSGTAELLLSADGGTLVAGSPDDNRACPGIHRTPQACVPSGARIAVGAVHVFARDANHVWRQEAFIKHDQPIPSNAWGIFGREVVLSGDGSWLSAGSDRSLVSPVLEADIYRRAPDGSWQHDSRLTAADLGTTDLTVALPEVQHSVTPPLALSGDGSAFVSRVSTLTYPPELEEPLAVDGVRVFRRGEAGWSLEAELSSPLGSRLPYRGEDGDGFGASPALDHGGHTLAVGAPLDNGDAGGVPSLDTYGSGGVYVYERDAAGVWQAPSLLKPAFVGMRDAVGARVALAADGRVLVANALGKAARAPGVHRAFTEDSVLPVTDYDLWGAAVYLFEKRDAGWEHRAAFIAPARGAVTYGFTSLALSADGGAVAVGSIPFAADGPIPSSVFVY